MHWQGEEDPCLAVPAMLAAAIVKHVAQSGNENGWMDEGG